MSRRRTSLLLVLLATALCAFVPAAQADFLYTDGGNGFSAAAHQVDDPTDDAAADDASDVGDDNDANDAESVNGYEDTYEDDDAINDPAPATSAKKHAKKKGKKAKPARRGRKPAKSKSKASPKHKSAKRR